MNNIGLKIKELRESKNLSQSALAREIGMTPQAISTIESGNSTPNGKNVKKLADFFEVEISVLYGSTNTIDNFSIPTNKNINILSDKTEEFLEFLKEENKRLWGIIAKLTNDPSFCVGNDQHALQECKVVTLPDSNLRSVA